MRITAHMRVGAWLAPFLLITSVAAAADLRLVEAVKNQDKEAARLLLKQRIDVKATQPDGSTALHWAVQWNDLETAKALIGAGADVDAANDNGITPLSLASTNGSGELVVLLLESGAKLTSGSPGPTMLMLAARTGSVTAVKALLSHGADVNAKESLRGQTALMWAATEGQIEVVRVLVEHRADVRAASKAGFTPLLFAARTGDVKLVEFFLGAGARVNDAAADGTTALLVATIRSHTTLARFLLEHGADPNLGAGFTPLHWAAGDWRGGSEVVSDSLLPPADDNEWSALQGLRGQAKTDFIKLLIAHGADPNARAKGTPKTSGAARGGPGADATPFWFAAKAADVNAMRLLAANGADPLLPNWRQTTPLMIAAGVGGHGPTSVPENAALAAVKLCVELGADVNAVDALGETALHGAAYRSITGSATIVKFLADAGARLNMKNKVGWTPLAISEGIYFGGSDTRGDPTSEVLRALGAEPSSPDVERDGDIAYIKAGLEDK